MPKPRNAKVKGPDPAAPIAAASASRVVSHRARAFPIVAIGGSAGGLEAFTQLLEHVPADTGMGFIFVQHLDPAHESALPEILGRSTVMPVHEARQLQPVRPNEVYVISPNTTMSLARGRLRVKRRRPGPSPHHSIDIFFKSLAEDRGEGSIGVVFSGNATDGTAGIEAIKTAGGITFAQDRTARYDSMPRSAIASGCVDHVMSPPAVGLELARLAAHPYLRGAFRPEVSIAPRPARGAAPARKPADGFAIILAHAREQSGVDFSLYKASTIRRRISRRMVLGRKTSLEDYAQFVVKDPREFKALYVDLLLNVTSFFRDAGAFEALKKEVMPKLIAEKPGGLVRMWSIGCSSGQEAYSLGMTFLEAAEGVPGPSPKLQIFGTDLNEALLLKARHGLFPKAIAEEVSPERLRKFFVEEDGGYRVIKALREVCIFARQDLLGDPPFSRMDLVTCRNVLIYLEPAAQRRILPMLHYALRPGGVLFLGNSESVGTFTDLFDPFLKKQKIFTRKSASTPAFSIPTRDRLRPGIPAGGTRPRLPEQALRTGVYAQQEMDRVLINLFAPPGVLVDGSFNVLQFHGTTGPYLTSPRGKASFQILKLAREPLVPPLRAALEHARRHNETARRDKVPLGGERGATVTLEVIPLRNLREPHYLILFRDPAARPSSAAEPPAATPAGRKGGDPALRRRNASLERELREVRDYLESLQQQHDMAHDELQASAEEVQSSNEELQSINEELETSKEEMESGYEELVTVNEEMAYRNGELSLLNSDLNNFHVSLSTPIVVLGRDLTIRRFTPLAEKLFNLLSTDIGRPIGGIRHNLELEDLEGFVRKVIDLLAAREVEVRDRDGCWHLLRARPYLTVDNKVDGAVLVLLDIDALKRSEQAITQERNYAEATLRTARDAIIILRPDLTVNTANDAFYRAFALTPAQTENRPLFELAGGAWNIPALRVLLADVLPRNHFFNDLEVTHRFGVLGERTMMLNGRRLESEDGEPLRILLSMEDVTEGRRSRAALRASEIRYRRLFEAAKDGVLIVDPATRRITDANPFMTQLLGFRRDEFLGKELYEIGLFRDEAAAQEAFRQLRERQEIRYEHLPLKGKDGRAHQVEVVANLYDEDGRAVIQCNIRDITERKRLEAALQASESYFRELTENLPIGVWTSRPDRRTDFVNRHWLEYTGAVLDPTAEDSEGFGKALHPDDRARASAISESGTAAGEAYGMEVRFRSALSGDYRWFLLRSVPVIDTAGVLQKRVGICIDIDDLNHAQEVLADNSALLEEQIQLRTVELRETIGELETFSYSVSHDMRAPLRAMQGFAQLVLQRNATTLDAASVDQLHRINASAARLDLLIGDVLTYSRLLRSEIVLEAVSLAGVVHRVVANYPQLQANGADIAVEGFLPDVLANEASLTQVISNLLTNAVKFMAPGIEARVRVHAEEIDGDVRLWIEDNGIGIEARDLQRIWTIFTRIGRARDYDGTGIGLAIVRKSVERMNGTVGVESEPGRGSRFWVRLAKG